jgi:hypothetical protein
MDVLKAFAINFYVKAGTRGEKGRNHKVTKEMLHKERKGISGIFIVAFA